MAKKTMRLHMRIDTRSVLFAITSELLAHHIRKAGESGAIERQEINVLRKPRNSVNAGG